ncbi:MAG: LCP family protein [Clostridiales bacterium]|nr:LCP family protein [Clostridiales bacterium]
MDKESYSIDDILSEVKKRREENELKLSGEDEKKTDEEKQPEFELNEDNGSSKSDRLNDESTFTVVEDGISADEIKSESPTEQNDEKEQKVSSFDEEKPEQEPEIKDKTEAEKEPEPELKIEDEPKAEPEVKPEADEKAEANDIDVKAEEDAVSDNQTVEKAQSEPEEEDGMVDLMKLVEEKEDEEAQLQQTDNETKEKVKFSKTKKGKILISVIVILLVLVIGAGIFAAYYINDRLNTVTNNDDSEPYEKVTYYDGMDFLQEDFPAIEEMSADEFTTYKEYLKAWYENGDPVSSTHVLNVLLIGEDTRDEEISDNSRADSAIIASVNIDTGEINLTSVLRDLYVYFEVDGEGQYGKINAAASLGGMTTYIYTIERYYKISIDNYVVVNFASFPKIIDSLGGVEITITSEEIDEINNHQKRYNYVTIEKTFDGDEGTMLLDGEQALAYCRIRKIDSDNARADRQKTVLMALFEEVQSSGTIDAVKIINELVDYVSTGYSKKELISIANTALRDGWLNYEIVTSNVPSTENSKGGQNFNCAPGTWIWVADFPKDAYELQTRIYGKSNIQLNDNRPDYLTYA